MSSTKRGGKRHVSDYYVTPVDEILTFLAEFECVEPGVLHNAVILDPCAGGDARHDMSYPRALRRFGIVGTIHTVDIRSDSRAEVVADYLQYNSPPADVIITNPPFSHALPIIKKALREVNNNGFVIMLLRLNFFGSRKRLRFWHSNMPKYCFVHHKRMSFSDRGGTDSIEYAHFVWQQGFSPEFTRLKVI